MTIYAPLVRMLILSLSIAVFGCDPASFLVVGNQSAQSYEVRYTPDPIPNDPAFALAVRTWNLPPGRNGVALGHRTGTLPGTIDLLDANCRVLQSWKTSQGGQLDIQADGHVVFTAPNQGAPDPAIGAEELEQSTNCR